MHPDTVIHPFEPVFDDNSRILILGSMPSPRSRENGFYYGHPQNRFWNVLAAVFEKQCPRTNEAKRTFVLHEGIALWDVLHSCSIAGADDASIREPRVNDLSALIKAGVKRIYTTGKMAHRLYTAYCAPQTGIKAVYLPSTSAANRGRWPLEKLIEAYRILAEPI
ncbi:DNA-deoxyinosine glycosylase [Treponema sp. OMZ 840]|uniref:DNA-deoxyinosine glycosylase n=1 Tax=Treponema sp. OMZ 840 TaxID=244313 RepID=UPI003D89D8FE